MLNEIYLGDCLELMDNIENNSIDMILCDLPYGMLSKKLNKWDVPLPLDKLWCHYNRIIKKNGTVALFGMEPYTSKLRLSNKNYKYDWYWQKERPTNFLNCKKQPLRIFENICIFYEKQCKYYPQLVDKKPENIRINQKYTKSTAYDYNINNEYERTIPYDKSYPTNLLEFKSETTAIRQKMPYHPNQKPIALLEYLIKTYTTENEIVLDNCCGAGSTCVAAKNINRKFIGIEKEEKYYEMAVNRIKKEENK